MYIYHITDDRGWYNHRVYKNLAKAREAALNFMDKAAWAATELMTIHRIDTKTEEIEDLEFVIHGAHRAEAHRNQCI